MKRFLFVLLLSALHLLGGCTSNGSDTTSEVTDVPSNDSDSTNVVPGDSPGDPGSTFVPDNAFRQEVVAAGDKVADWQIDHFSYQSSGNLHDHGIDAWTNGVLYLGMTRWAGVSPQGETYFNWLYNNIGEKNHWQIPANFVGHPRYGIYHADELCVGQFYIELYKKYNRPEMIQSTIQRLNQIMSNPPNDDMAYTNKQSWTWCDALFMAPPVYLGIARLQNDASYAEFMHDHFMKTYRHLYDKQDKLFYRDDSYLDKREANGEKIFWGRGNGWVVAGLANILLLLPEDDPRGAFYTDLYKSMMERLAELQDPEGYWHASLLDPASYPAPETSATALIVYALAYGINNNILEADKYMEPLQAAWQHLLSVIDEEGKLGWVQPIGADPKSVTAEMTAVYGVGAFLMAATEIHRLN